MAINQAPPSQMLSLRARLSLYCYRTLTAAATLAALPLLPLLRSCSRRVREGLNDFLGNVARPAGQQPVLWVHGVSMGESMVATGFAVELQKRFPQYQVVFSTTHPDVLASVKKREIAGAVAYFPLDNLYSMRRAFARWRPVAVFVAETDFWPEFSYQCRLRNIPLILINGRISHKIASFYQQFSGLSQVVFSSYSLLAVQSRVDADRLLAMGVCSDKIKVLGNMKADLTAVAASVREQDFSAWLAGRRCVIFGSIHPDEFILLKAVFAKLVGEGIAVLVAPRNPSHAQKWGEELSASGLEADCRSRIGQKPWVSLLLLDTMGELSALYRMAAVAFVGGSLNKVVGGHNPLEVIQQGVPLIMGPHCRNFADLVVQLREGGGIITCDSADSLLKECCELLADSEKAAAQVETAAAVLAANRGAIDQTILAVSQFLS